MTGDAVARPGEVFAATDQRRISAESWPPRPLSAASRAQDSRLTSSGSSTPPIDIAMRSINSG